MPEINEEEIQKAKLRAIEVLEKEITDIDTSRESIKSEISEKKKTISALEKEIADLKLNSERLSEVREDVTWIIKELKEEQPQTPVSKRLMNIIKATLELSRENN